MAPGHRKAAALGAQGTKRERGLMIQRGEPQAGLGGLRCCLQKPGRHLQVEQFRTVLQGESGFQKGSRGIQAAHSKHRGRARWGTNWSQRYLGGGEGQGRCQQRVAGPSPLPVALLSAKEPLGPLPNLGPAPQSGSQTSPLQPCWLLSQTAFFLPCRIGPRARSPLPQRPSWACHPPPATRPRGPPSAPAGVGFGRLCALRPLCSLIMQPVGLGARARDLLWVLGGV